MAVRFSSLQGFFRSVGGTKARRWPSGAQSRAGAFAATTCEDSGIPKGRSPTTRPVIGVLVGASPKEAPPPPLTLIGNSLGGWIAWLIAQGCDEVERLILIAPAFNMMGVRAKTDRKSTRLNS